MQAESTPFVEGWEFVQTLGEGAYGEVKLAVCQSTMECVAVKIIHLTNQSVQESVQKEICIHRMLSHKNILKFYGYRKASEVEYLFLKYASGGELFDRIEPDVGMPISDALRHFHSLIEGVEYLHSRGVCHRDLKPENLLLDENDVLQITDFGMATVFRYQGQEREVSRMCGTKPYTAPEVLKGVPYRAEPADVWSCGIILVTLLAGELPWDAPVQRDKMYRTWKECCITSTPWNKINTLALSLCRAVLVENPKRRYTLPQIKKHQFYNKSFPLREEGDNLCSSPGGHAAKRRRTSVLDDSGRLSSPPGGVSASQPDRSTNENNLSSVGEVWRPMSFSQPAQPEDMLLSTQMQFTPGTSQTPYQSLVKRMTRFFVTTSRLETIEELTSFMESQGYGVKTSSFVLTVTTVDKTKARLIFKICLIDMAGNLLVDFRLSKGDGLEFKRHFVKIKTKLKHIIRKTQPTWPVFGSDKLEGGSTPGQAGKSAPAAAKTTVVNVPCGVSASHNSATTTVVNVPCGVSASQNSATTVVDVTCGKPACQNSTVKEAHPKKLRNEKKKETRNKAGTPGMSDKKGKAEKGRQKESGRPTRASNCNLQRSSTARF